MAKEASGGTSVATVLLIVFVTLKLCGVVGWSWWWVMAPLWVPAGAAVFLLAVAAMLAAATRS